MSWHPVLQLYDPIPQCGISSLLAASVTELGQSTLPLPSLCPTWRRRSVSRWAESNPTALPALRASTARCRSCTHNLAVRRQEATLWLFQDDFDSSGLLVRALRVQTPGAKSRCPIELVHPLHAVGSGDNPALANQRTAADELSVLVDGHIPRCALR